jgi:hypothetical protein
VRKCRFIDSDAVNKRAVDMYCVLVELVGYESCEVLDDLQLKYFAWCLD